ncbi:hypothetical protein ACFQDG_16350 [Natronoarchaeum mannanilyticum]|uniref:Glutamate/valine-rich protein n=1 Tax=Natronoarchaeum mannanilyticum TaxID=926360 RepID=A0AAV3TAG5_9EURY
MNPRRVDAAVDLAYGALIFVAVVLIAVEGARVGVAFGFGVLVSYAIHVVWKMSRFDPEWMTQEVEQTVEKTVEETVEQTVEEEIGSVEQTVEQELEGVQEQVESVEERVDRRPREDEIADLLDETDGESGDDER